MQDKAEPCRRRGKEKHSVEIVHGFNLYMHKIMYFIQ
jgi:hypothetical protein